MFENVLVGVDGRPNGRDAIALASALTGPDGKLTLVHVYHDAAPSEHADSHDHGADSAQASRELLEREREHTQLTPALVGVMASSPGRGLHEQAEQLHADLIVVGSSARGLLGRAMLGDDARASLNGAPCAVALAARGYASDPRPLKRIGVGYDEAPESAAALSAAGRLGRALGARVSALEVVSIPAYAYSAPIAPPMGDTADVMVEQAQERMRSLPDVDGRAIYGLAGEELAAFGDELDLLVVGSRSYGPLRRLVLGSTSNYLQRHARCNLLVLPRLASSSGAVPDGEEHVQADQALTSPRASA